jgi:hypothetical protein
MLGGNAVLANIIMLRRFVTADGHLVMEGDETSDELREALRNLWNHGPAECQQHGIGIPVQFLIVDKSILVPKKRGPRKKDTLQLPVAPEPESTPLYGGTPDVWWK